MPRLDPSAPPLWRDDRTVQFGSPARAQVTLDAPWHAAALDALENGTTLLALRGLARVAGADDDDVETFLTRLAPALDVDLPSPRMALQVAEDVAPDVVRAVRLGIPDDTEVIPWAGERTEAPQPGRTVVLLGAYRVDPRRAASLVRDEVPHLPLVLDARRAAVGPLVVPGTTACLSCLDATARAQDPLWPVIAAQLLARPRPHIDAGFATEAARAARHHLSAKTSTASSSLHLRAGSPRRSWRRHRPSADCRCRSLEGTATATARSVRARGTS